MPADDVVLVIDDDREVARALHTFIEKEGFEVAVAHTGASGLGRIREGGVGLVLLDLRLPDMGGVEIMRAALGVPAPPEFVIVTGHATLDTAMEAVEGSATGYLPKPVDFSRLGTIVRRVIDRRRLMRENTRLQRELAERLAESETLAAIAGAVSSTLDVPEALRRICRELARLLGADSASAYLLDPATDQLVPTAGYHAPKEHLAALATMTLPAREQSFFQPLWHERRVLYTDDVPGDPRFRDEAFRLFPHQSGLLLPLTTGDEVVGGFYIVWWTARRSPTARELHLLDRVSAQVGLLLRNARLYEQAERNQHRLAVLNEVSARLAAVHEPEEVLSLIVNEAARLLRAEAAGIRLLEGADLLVGARTESAAALMSKPRIKAGESLSGRVVSTCTPLVVKDLAADTMHDPVHKRAAIEHGYRGFVGVPLRSRAQVLGTLNIYTKGVRHFRSDEVALLQGLADQASTAIEKARLFRETEEGRQLLARLYQAAIEMQSSWGKDDRLRAFVRASREVVGFDRVSVYLVSADGATLEHVTTVGDDGPAGPSLPCGPGAGPYEQVLEGRRPIAVLSDEDLSAVRPLDPAFRTHSFFRSRRFVVAPLTVGERVIGVVSADNKTTRRPIPPSSVEPFGALCQSLAGALEESRLYAEANAREQEARKLYRVTRQLATSLDREELFELIVSHTVDLTGCEASGIYVRESEQEGLVLRRGLNLDVSAPARRLGERAAGRALAEGRPVWARDRGAPPRALIGVPIVSRDRAHGVLLGCRAGPHDFTEREIQLLSTLADHAALALENADLLDETRAQEARLYNIFDSTSDGIVLVGRAGEIQAANSQAGTLLGFSVDDVIGSELMAVLKGPSSALPDADEPLAALHALLAQPERQGEGDLEFPSTGRVIHWSARPTRAAAGGTIGLTLTLRDVTQEREVARMKTDFVSFVTHQLRTPLSGISWLLELAEQGPGVPEEPLSYVRDARQAAVRLSGLVKDLLDVSRLESGRLEIHPQPVNLAKLTGSVLGDLGTLVREKGHRLAVEGADTVPAVTADPQLLRQVILNLASNAVKYTPPGGEITIRMTVADRAVRWAISDSGIGVPKQSQARLFEKFYRAENVNAVETEGTGLGLYLVKLIVERLAGEVRCESEEGEGATFIFTLPACARES